MLPIHTHSEYSALDGFATCTEIADRIEALGLPGAFLTDHGLVTGHREFAKVMSERGLYHGFGIEAYQAKTHRADRPEKVEYINKNGRKASKRPRDAAHVILLAQSQKGLTNLYRLSDEANRTGFYHSPRLDWELLEKYNEGIICTSACMGGLVSKEIEEGSGDALQRYLSIFGERFFIELHTYHSDKQREVNKELYSIAVRLGIPLVYANDAHYACAEEHMMHELCLNVQMASDFRAPKNLSVDGEIDEDHTHDGDNTCYHPQSLYIMSEQDVRRSLDYLPEKAVDEAIANSDLIADLCKTELPKSRMHMPLYKAPQEKNNKDYLWELVDRGLRKRYGGLTNENYNRARFEYEAITDVDLGGGATLGDYFLINWDWITQFCPRNGILTGPGRGSVGGSILAYALGITHIDPLKYDLPFERFWNPGRAKGFPDIDTDVEISRRAEVKQYLADKYGAERVLTIGNTIRFRPKSALERCAVTYFGREAMKANDGALYRELDTIKSIMDSTIDAGQQPSWSDMWELVGHQLEPYRNASQDWRNVFELAEKLEGRISTYGIHASAVVVSDVDLPEIMPSRSAKPKAGEKIRPLVTQCDMEMVEEQGFLKLDALGLRNLDTLSTTAKLAGENIDWWAIDYDKVIPEEAWQLIDDELTLGLFQIEEGQAAKYIARRMKPRSVEDLGAIVALNRPGPLRSGMVERYLERRDNPDLVEFKHPILEPIQKSTFGDFLYQEQVIKYFQAIGYSASDSDYIRKILGKKLTDEMNKEFVRYMEYAQKHMSAEIAEEIWHDIIGFSKYSFNKAHAIEYGTILAATIYAKWRKKVEFVMACIQNNPKKVGAYITEARRMGVAIQPPSINFSDPEITVKDETIYFGLADVKGVGKGAAKMICKLRNEVGSFESYDDFLGELHYASSEWDHAEVKSGRSPKQLCTQGAIDALQKAGSFDCISGVGDPYERAALQKELIGVSLIDLYSKQIKENQHVLQDIPSIAELEPSDGLRTRTYGIIDSVDLKKTRADAHPRFANKDFAMLGLEWEGRIIKAVVFNQQWEKYKDTLTEGSLCLMELKFNERGAQLVAGGRL